MKNCLLPALLIAGISACFPAFSQASAEQKEVEQLIRHLFLGMQKGDSAMVHATLTNDLTSATVFRNKNGSPVLHLENGVEDFLKAVGTPHKEIWYEEIWGMKINIDGDFAQAWCDYAFYTDNTFSHCGVDAFHLHKSKDGWKIFHIADTRRKEGCNIPSDIEKKHK